MLERVRRGRSSIQIIVHDMAALIFFIRRQPRTIGELSELSGQDISKVRRTLEALVGEGLVDRSDRMETVGKWRQSYTFSWHQDEAAEGEPC